MKLALTLSIATLISLGQACFPWPPRPPPTTTTSAPATTVTGECQCGVTSVNRIVGGVDAAKGEFPWQVALVR